MKDHFHILIAEDDMEDQYIMTRTFDELGHTDLIKFVENGEMAVSYLKQLTESNISLIILDLNMPCLNGTETLRWIKSTEKYSNVPVIIFSTSVNEIEKQICIELGIREYITKPSKYFDYISVCNSF